MGAHYVDITFEASDEATLKKQFSDYCEDERFENGHGAYSGVLNSGIRVVPNTFKTESEASEWVAEHARKWESALAVRMGDFSKAYHNTTKGSKLIALVSNLRAEIEGFDANLLKKLSQQKSLFKGCTNCGSKISVKHFVRGKSTACPVCQSELVKSPKDKVKLKGLIETLSVKEKELREQRNEFKKKLGDKKPYWYVGGWASS